jgi:hypothetical protein
LPAFLAGIVVSGHGLINQSQVDASEAKFKPDNVFARPVSASQPIP